MVVETGGYGVVQGWVHDDGAMGVVLVLCTATSKPNKISVLGHSIDSAKLRGFTRQDFQFQFPPLLLVVSMV